MVLHGGQTMKNGKHFAFPFALPFFGYVYLVGKDFVVYGVEFVEYL